MMNELTRPLTGAEERLWQEKLAALLVRQIALYTANEDSSVPAAAARELLEKTNMRMYEVCDAVGYNSVEHFLRTFKRATGQTPLQYRKENVKKHQ